jgi:hypothetical protein
VNLDVFFNEGDKDRWVPRTILVDLNMSDLQQLITERFSKTISFNFQFKL